MHVDGILPTQAPAIKDKIRIFCPIQTLKADLESAENYASNCDFKIFKIENFHYSCW